MNIIRRPSLSLADPLYGPELEKELGSPNPDVAVLVATIEALVHSMTTIHSMASNINEHCYPAGKLQCSGCSGSQQLIQDIAKNWVGPRVTEPLTAEELSDCCHPYQQWTADMRRGSCAECGKNLGEPPSVIRPTYDELRATIEAQAGEIASLSERVVMPENIGGGGTIIAWMLKYPAQMWAEYQQCENETTRLEGEIAALREERDAYKAWPEIHEMLTAKGINKIIITDGEQGYCKACKTQWGSPSMESHATLHWDFIQKTGIFAALTSTEAKE